MKCTMYTVWVCLLLIVAVNADVPATANVTESPNVVCYFPSWGVYRGSPYKFDVRNLDVTYCTHVIWSFATIDGSRVQPASIEHAEQLSQLVALKKDRKTSLKILVSVGGATASDAFSKVARTMNMRAQFVASLAKYVRENKLDGADIDWEFPTAGEADSFVEILRMAGTLLHKQGSMLSVALGAARATIERAYKLELISSYVDLINLMMYDLHGHWDNMTGLQSAIHPKELSVYTVDWIVSRYLSLGLNASKAVLGIPFYGRSYTLCADTDDRALLAKTCGPGTQGTYSQAPGTLFYYEICNMLKEEEWTTVYDSVGRVPYAYRGDQWICYDNPRSIGEKVAYMKTMNLSGIMIWDMSTDDFRGHCGEGANPLMKAIADALGFETSTSTSTAVSMRATWVIAISIVMAWTSLWSVCRFVDDIRL